MYVAWIGTLEQHYVAYLTSMLDHLVEVSEDLTAYVVAFDKYLILLLRYSNMS